MASSAPAAAAAGASDVRRLKLQVVRLPGRAKHIFTDLSSSLRMGEFQQLLSRQFSVAPSQQALFVAGVPPRPVSTDDANATLADLGIRAGDSIELRDDESATGGGAEMKQGKAGSWEVIGSIPTNSGRFVRRDMPRDNSCLFHAVAAVCAGEKSPNLASAHSIRELAANLVASDPATYNSVFLASPNALYQEHILNPNTWGGAIELAIFAAHFRTEILAFDLLNLREDRFGSEDAYAKRVFLVYTGDHYDALAFSGAIGQSDQVLFSSKDEHAWSRARDAIMAFHSELAAQGKCQKQTEWRHDKGIKRANAASRDADLERERRVAAERAKISSSAGDSLPSPPRTAAASSSSSGASAAAADASTSVATATAVPVAADEWSCPRCTCCNKLSQRLCVACDAPNPNAPAAAPSQPAPAAAATPAAAPSSGGYVSPPGSFNCAACTAFNEQPSAECAVCGTLQPGASGSSSRPIDVDSMDDDDGVRAPLPQRDYQLIGGEDDMLPAASYGLTPAQREAMAEPWNCARCQFGFFFSHAHIRQCNAKGTMHNEPNTITCSACRSPHPHPLLNPATAFGAARGGAAGSSSSSAPAQPATVGGRVRALFAPAPQWTCERCGKVQSSQLFCCGNCKLPNAGLQDRIHGGSGGGQGDCSIM